MSKALRLVLISLLFLGSLRAAPTIPWTMMKVGMSIEEVVTLLGDPVFRRKARGFETLTYDQGAEVLICGLVVGWTLPSSTAVLVRSEDVWSNHPKGDYLAPVRAVLRSRTGKAPAATVAKPATAAAKDASGMGYEEYLQTLGRNKG